MLQQLAALPEGLESSFPEGEGAARKEKVRTALDNLQSSMDWLRVSVKYLVFDLEATKRDNELAGTSPRGLRKRFQLTKGPVTATKSDRGW